MTAADRPSIPRVGDILTTAEQLDALPLGSVMRAQNDLLAETGTMAGRRVVWAEGWSDHSDTIEYLAPLMVLYVPGEQPGPSTDQALAEAWAEGHRTGWEHCQDGNYGNDHWDDPTPNPYAAAGRAETREGVGTGAGEGDDPAPTEATSWVTRSTDCPEAPAQAHPLPSVTDNARAETGWIEWAQNLTGAYVTTTEEARQQIEGLVSGLTELAGLTSRAAGRAETTTATDEDAALTIRYATLDDGTVELDEVVALNATVHLEKMDTASWGLGIAANGEHLAVNLGVDEDGNEFAHAEPETGKVRVVLDGKQIASLDPPGLVTSRPFATARTRPTRDEVARAIRLSRTNGLCKPGVRCDLCDCAQEYEDDLALRDADAVLALYAHQPTEAEAGARALEDAADEFEAIEQRYAIVHSPVAWLRERADRTRDGAR